MKTDLGKNIEGKLEQVDFEMKDSYWKGAESLLNQHAKSGGYSFIKKLYYAGGSAVLITAVLYLSWFSLNTSTENNNSSVAIEDSYGSALYEHKIEKKHAAIDSDVISNAEENTNTRVKEQPEFIPPVIETTSNTAIVAESISNTPSKAAVVHETIAIQPSNTKNSFVQTEKSNVPPTISENITLIPKKEENNHQNIAPKETAKPMVSSLEKIDAVQTESNLDITPDNNNDNIASSEAVNNIEEDREEVIADVDSKIEIEGVVSSAAEVEAVIADVNSKIEVEEVVADIDSTVETEEVEVVQLPDNLEKPLKTKAFSFSLEASGGLSYITAQKASAQIASPNAYIIEKRNSEEFNRFAPEIGLGLNLHYKNWALHTSLRYLEYGEKIKYTPTESTITTIQDNSYWDYYTYQVMVIIKHVKWLDTIPVDLIDSNYVSQIDTITSTGNDSTLMQGNGVNKVSYLEIPLLVGYEHKFKNGLGIYARAGIALGIYQKAKGYYADDSNPGELYSLEQNGNDHFTKATLNYIFKPGISLTLSPRIDVFAEGNFRRSAKKNFSNSTLSISQRYNTFGVLGGVRFKL